MSNIRTIADTQQDEYSVQSIALREMTGDLPVILSLLGSSTSFLLYTFQSNLLFR
jgi:hypothetical protein